MIIVFFTCFVSNPMWERNSLASFLDATTEITSPLCKIKSPPGMYTSPSLSTPHTRIFVCIFARSSAISIPSNILPSGIANLINSACPCAKEFTSRADGRNKILAASLAASSSGLIIIARPSFSRRYPASLL